MIVNPIKEKGKRPINGLNKGFLKMTIPETPNDPNQKYVKA